MLTSQEASLAAAADGFFSRSCSYTPAEMAALNLGTRVQAPTHAPLTHARITHAPITHAPITLAPITHAPITALQTHTLNHEPPTRILLHTRWRRSPGHARADAPGHARGGPQRTKKLQRKKHFSPQIIEGRMVDIDRPGRAISLPGGVRLKYDVLCLAPELGKYRSK